MAEIAQSQILPAPFIEAAAKPYLEKIQEVYGKPVDVSKFMGQQFVAGPGALQTQAEGLAGGLGRYEPYLQSAGQYLEELDKLNKQLQVWLDHKLIKLICLHTNKM
jgi:hypothetical protein